MYEKFEIVKIIHKFIIVSITNLIYMKYVLIILFIVLPFSNLLSQQEEYQVGLNPNQIRQSQGAYYDYSDPDGINIKVAIWGYVKYPGRYIVPIRTDIKDLISYSGGINDDAYLDDLRIFRLEEDSSQVLIKVNYDDLWWGDSLTTNIDISRLIAGDVLIIPGRQKLYWEQYTSLFLGVFAVLISRTALIISIN